jgi:transposase
MIASRSCTWKRGVACRRRWLLSCGYEVEEVAEILSFSPRWVRALLKRYNEGGGEALGDQRIHNGTKPTILTPEALAALKERIKAPPDDGGLWSGPKIARGLAKFHGVRSVHDQRGWDALIAMGYSIQQPRPRHPDAATEEDRAALKKSLRPRLTRSGVNIRAQASKSGRWMPAWRGGHPRPVSAWIHAHSSGLMWPFVQALTMSVEAKIKVITCWSLSDQDQQKGRLSDGEADQGSDCRGPRRPSVINRKLSANNELLRVHKRNGRWLVAHLVRDEGVAGSNPATPTGT